MEKVEFKDPVDGESVEFYVLEQTKIMKETIESDGESTYDMVEDDTELNALAKVFAEMMDDVEIV